jgi:hypothetical protein
MRYNHWEVSWTSLRRLTDHEVQRAVEAIARIGCSFANFAVETVERRYVAVRHRCDDEFLLEFGFAQDAPCCSHPHALDRGLVDQGRIVWNWCCTRRRQPETGLVIHKLRQVQGLTGDKLLVWDDDGMSHWSWGSCPLEQSGHDPMTIIDAHLHDAPSAFLQPKAS